MLNNLELKDRLLCGIGGVYNCSKCRFLKECRQSYDNFAVGELHKDKQLFKLVNPNA